MHPKLKILKDKLFYYVAEKNWGVSREYLPYVDAHREEHNKHRLKHLWMLLRLNVHYRILRRQDVLYYTESSPVVKKKSSKSTPQHLPYLKGSESGLSKRRREVHLAKEMRLFDVISFDIFDTLILRPFAKPTDLFMLVGKRLKKTDFHRIRIEAEKAAREKAMAERGSREITIDEIYSIIEAQTGIPKELGIETELNTEMDYCVANPYIKRAFDMLKAQGKTLIIASDMYLPYEMMEKLLHKAGYTGYDKLYVSCDYGCSKESGALYRYIKRDYEGKKIAHIGDNQNADVGSAGQQGLTPHYYKSVGRFGNTYRAEKMSALIGSAYAGTVNIHLHNGTTVYSPHYEYGFTYGGLYVLGFASWLNRKMESDHVDKLLFLGQDDICQQVLRSAFGNMRSDCLPWSSFASAKYIMANNRDEFLRCTLGYCARRNDLILSVGDMLDQLSLQALAAYLPDYKLNADTLVCEDNRKALERLFTDHWDVVAGAYDAEREYLKAYLRRKIGNAKRVALVDSGWLGNELLALKSLIEEDMQLDCDVRCWQSVCCTANAAEMMPALLDGSIETYRASITPTRQTTCYKTENKFLRIFSLNNAPAFLGWDSEGRMTYGVPPVEDYETIDQVRAGILDFVKQYTRHFHDDAFMLNISSIDAWRPYQEISSNKDYFQKHFSSLSWSGDIHIGDKWLN